MTARRRRKSGSGPSATALIAWVGGAQPRGGEPAAASLSAIDGGSCGRVSGARAVLAGRACGLAAGTLLACGSVLVGTAYVGDGSLAGAGDSAPLLKGTPTVPVAGVGTPNDYRGNLSTGRTPAVPDMVRAQAVADTNPARRARLGRVRRNTPVSLDLPAEPHRGSATPQRPGGSPAPSADPAPSGPVAAVSPLLDPTAKRVGRVAPVGGVLTPINPREKRVGSPHGDQAGSSRGAPAAGPRDELASLSTRGGVGAVKRVIVPARNVPQPAAQPAMAMLASVLPLS
jgi:hypothetical protein